MRTLTTLSLTLPLMALMACNGDVDGNDDTGIDDPETRTGTVEGRVDDQGRRAAVSGAVMAAFVVESDGSLTRIDDEDNEVTTDASGRYSLDVMLGEDVSALTDVIVRASSESFGEGHVIVSGDIEADQTTTAAPIDYESSLEAEIFIDATADGQWQEDEMNTAFLRTLVRANVASELDVVSDSSRDADLDVFSDVVVSSMLTFGSMLESSALSAGADGSDLDFLLESMTEAQITFDEQADSASTVADLDTAFETQVDSVFQAFDASGMTAGDVALTVDAMTETMILFEDEWNNDVSDVALGEMSWLRVRAKTEALVEGFNLLDGSGDDVEDDGMTLLGDLEAALTSSISIIDVLGTDFMEFTADLKADLESSFSVTELLDVAPVIADAEDEQTQLESALALSTETSVEGRADAVTQAMTELALDIDSSANATVLSNAGLTEDEVDGTLSILVQLNSMTELGS